MFFFFFTSDLSFTNYLYSFFSFNVYPVLASINHKMISFHSINIRTLRKAQMPSEQ